jgi:DNA-binding response OmpR family regulator
VLIVEDDPGVLKLMVGLLRAAGHEVLGAACCQEAESLVELHGQPKLLITDLVLPDRGGDVLAERLRAARPGLPVIFCSGYGDDRLAVATRYGEWGSLLRKPFSPRELLARVGALSAVATESSAPTAPQYVVTSPSA